MDISVNHISLETKWAMTAKGLTGALTAHLNALYNIVGKEKYVEVIRQIWAQIGKGSAEGIESLGLTADNAKSVGEAGATMCMCSMGPELKIEKIEESENKTVMKIHECPWKNRMNEFGITHDLLSACDVAFWGFWSKTAKFPITPFIPLIFKHKCP